ncbi:MAG TPA: FecR domain-containing protein [Acidobacteriota bacterium]|nr:FecR domain-containing protein [Acidobacteriota bacterium]
MKPNHRNPEAILDEVLEDIRRQQPEAKLEQEAAQRVWSRLEELSSSSSATAASRERLDSVDDFKALIPDYLQGRLPEARRILFEDQMRNSVTLRRAVKEARGEKRTVVPQRQGSFMSSPWFKWGAVAAMVLFTIGLVQLGVLDGILPRTTMGMASVRSVQGNVFQISPQGQTVLAAGQEIDWRQGIRSAKNTDVVFELADGSLMELRERSEFSISEARDGVTINLDRGSIIVQAAPRRKGHLYVRTNDCTVSVKGTIFSVSSGAKGTRVSVLEGRVEVEQGGKRASLEPGQQYTTNERLARVPLEREIAWSQNYDNHVALLRETRLLDQEFNRVFFPGLRFSSRFLDIVPAGTVIYAGLPNLAVSMADARDIFMQRVEANPALAEWWQKATESGEEGLSVMRVFDSLRELSESLGDEIVLAVQLDERGQPGAPLLMAEATDPSSFRQALTVQLERLKAETGLDNVVITDNPSSLQESNDTLYVYLKNDLVAMAPEIGQLVAFDASASSGRSAFADTSFHHHLDTLYRDGVDWVFGIGLKELMAAEGAGDLAESGIVNVEHFFVEMREAEGMIENRAMLTFDGERQGIASWLAAPAPIGGLDYVSQEASVAVGLAVREPVQLIDEVIAMLGDEARRAVAEIETQTGINLQADLAAPLGGEFVFAIDGPLLPMPSWKAVIEVYDPPTLQSTIERFVARADQELKAEGKKGVTLTSQDSGGRTYYRVSVLDLPLASFSYTFVEGYLVAAPARGLVADAIRFNEIGATLPHSTEFVNLLPRDGHTGFSAVAYQDLRSVLEPLAGLARGIELPEGEREVLDEAMQGMSASLVCAYAEEDRILFATTGNFGFNPSNLMGLSAFSLPGMEDVLQNLPGVHAK